MNMQELIYKIADRAAKTPDDIESNMLSDIADRLMNSGALFEAPLTPHEKNIINRFL
jgi:hypothetical protein